MTVCCGLLVQIRAKVAQQTQYASFERTEEAPCPHDCTPPFAVTCLHTSNYPASSRRDWRRVARLSDDTPRLRGHPRCLAPGRFQTPLAVRSLGPFVCRNCCAYPAEITLIPGALTFPFDEPVRKPSEGTPTSTADRPTVNNTTLSPSLLGSGGECSSTLLKQRAESVAGRNQWWRVHSSTSGKSTAEDVDNVDCLHATSSTWQA